MGIPSIMLQQHIGTVETWLSHVRSLPEAKELKKRGCTIKNGVFVQNEKLDVSFKPSSVDFNVKKINSPEIQSKFLELLCLYLNYIKVLDPVMLKHASELDRRKEELEHALVCESVVPGGRLWLRNASGVWHIEFVSVNRKEVEYKILNGKSGDVYKSQLGYLKLFLTYEDASNKMKEGWNVARAW